VSANPEDSFCDAGLGRRFGALFYDLLVLLGIVFIAALPLPWFDQITGGAGFGLWIKRLYLLGVCFAYFGGFWVKGGQTLGMKAWQLRVIRNNGRALGWGDAVKRFTGLCLAVLTLGLGFFWMPTDTRHSNWDKLCGTRVIWCRKPAH
tara:strand:+ start:2532 stop:2975 length:444 start_codon:yes stop_codon:yes gene_type:complete